jgi:PEP-CTERM motif-containing protein
MAMMMAWMKRYFAVIALAALPFANPANAALVYVGYWDVADPDAPLWSDTAPNGPLAYTGQEAAALLFGGSASEYSISTIDDSVANINNMAWYDIIGYGGQIFAEDYSNKYLGQYYGPTAGFNIFDLSNAASAYVRDNLVQGSARNYAFKDDGTTVFSGTVPEPTMLSMFLLALGGLVTIRHRATLTA